MPNIKPVFILGSPRSGTTLLNSVFFSTKQFALYQSETHLLDKCEPVYGKISKEANYQRFLADWLRSLNFQRAGIPKEEFVQAITHQDRQSYACFLKKFMDQIATRQGLDRWVESTPANVYHIEEIIATFPDVKIVHVIRDGRDAALSLRKLGWHGCKSQDTVKQLLYSALNWQEAVTRGCKAGRKYPQQYMELQYEDLVNDPGGTLNRLTEFTGVNFSEEQLKDVRFGSLKAANSQVMSEQESSQGGLIKSAVGRWKATLSEREKSWLSAGIGKTLTSLGYQQEEYQASWPEKMTVLYIKSRLRLNRWLRLNTILGRMSGGSLTFTQDSADNLKETSYD